MVWILGHKEATRKAIGKLLPYSQKKYQHDGRLRRFGRFDECERQRRQLRQGQPARQNINFGVRNMRWSDRERMTSHLKAFASGFFVFSIPMKPAIRLAAVMGIPTMFFFTHDSVGVGEDGRPTTRRQLAMFRSTPA
jgi:transketolase